MNYRVQVVPSAVRQLKKLPRHEQRRIRDAIDALACDPRPMGAKKLVGTDSLWRIRVGDYRIIYEIRDRQLLVVVIRVGHRKDVYRGE